MSKKNKEQLCIKFLNQLILGCADDNELTEFGKEVAEMFCKSFIIGVDEDD